MNLLEMANLAKAASDPRKRQGSVPMDSSAVDAGCSGSPDMPAATRRTTRSQRQPPRRRALQAARTRQEIVDGAIKVLAEFGPRSATVDQIAEAVGISPAAVYWHFGNREGLFLAAIEEISEAYSTAIRPSDNDVGESPEAYLRSAVAALMVMAMERIEIVQAQVALSADGVVIPSIRATYAHNTLGKRAPLIEAVRGGISNGSLMPVDAEDWVDFVLGSMKGAVMHARLYPASRQTIHRLLNVVHRAALLLLGLDVGPPLFASDVTPEAATLSPVGSRSG